MRARIPFTFQVAIFTGAHPSPGSARRGNAGGMTQDEAKREAARAALAELPEAGVVGLGSGSTAKLFIDEVGALVRGGRELRGVPTSEGSRRQAEALGIPLLPDDGPWAIDVTVDGADEVSDALDLVKGGGAAHTREKIVNYASARNVIIVDATKLSRRLGEKWPIPVEVLAFAHPTTASHLARLGEPILRKKDGNLVRTDAGNVIYDVRVSPLDAPAEMDRALRDIPGVVETGLFVGRCDLLIVASQEGTRRVRR
jgi:ribose 5-phosphate isomerase A